MALIIEDGTIVENANSFVTVQEARDYAAARGTTLPVADADVEYALVKAGDYLLSYESRLKGVRVDVNQTMIYPRQGVVLFDSLVDETNIPKQLKDAQIVLASYAADGTELRPVGTGREVRREEVGPIKKEYFEGGRSSINPVFNAVDDILMPLMYSMGGNFFRVDKA